MSSSTTTILFLPHLNPFDWDLSSLRGYVHSRHELVEQYPSTWTSAMVINSCPRDISYQNQRRRKPMLIEHLLEDFRISLRVVAPSFLGLENSRGVHWLDSIRPPMQLVMPDHYPLSQQESACFVENQLRFAEQLISWHQSAMAPYKLSWSTVTMMRSMNSAVAGSTL